jgi:hypothetical protein
MMKLTFNILLLTFFYYWSQPVLKSQSAFDSAMLLRNKTFTDYRSDQDANALHPWVKPADLAKKAKELIEIDNMLINNYLYNEIEKNKSLTDKVDNLTLELALNDKETELMDQALAGNKQLINTLIIIAGGFFLLFVISVIFLIDRHIRYRSICIEMDKTWPLKEEINRDRQLQDELIKLSRKVEDLTLKNASLTGEIDDANQKIQEKEITLAKEITSKMQIEEEIKKLIIQIKSQ